MSHPIHAFKSFKFLALAALLAAFPGFWREAAADDKPETVQMRTDWLPHGVHSIFFIGIEKDFYKKRGIDLKVVDGSGSGSTVQTVGTKVDAFGYVSASAVLPAVARGVPVKAVAALARADAFTLIVKDSSPIDSPKDLRGKTIVTSAGAFDAMLLPAFLKKVGLEPSSVTLLNVDAAAKLGIFLAGKADGVVQSAWFNLPVIQGAGHKVKTFPWRNYGIDLPGYVLIANTATISDKPDLVKRYVVASLEAQKYAYENPDEAIAALARNRPSANIKPNIAKEQLLVFRQYADTKRTAAKAPGWQSVEDWDEAQKLLEANGIIKKIMDPSAYFTNDFLP